MASFGLGCAEKQLLQESAGRKQLELQVAFKMTGRRNA
jgi:hypothetical protein